MHVKLIPLPFLSAVEAVIFILTGYYVQNWFIELKSDGSAVCVIFRPK